mgnify:CR=1 FL=1
MWLNKIFLFHLYIKSDSKLAPILCHHWAWLLTFPTLESLLLDETKPFIFFISALNHHCLSQQDWISSPCWNEAVHFLHHSSEPPLKLLTQTTIEVCLSNKKSLEIPGESSGFYAPFVCIFVGIVESQILQSFLLCLCIYALVTISKK